MTDPVDTSRFLSKEEASQRAGVSTKTLEDWNKAGRLAKATRQRDGRGPHQTVYDPDDLAVIIAERRGAPPTSLVAPGRNGNGHREGVEPAGGLIRTPADLGQPAEFYRALTEALVTVIGANAAKSEKSTSETSQKSLFLTIDEAAAVSGLSRTYLKRAIGNLTLPAVKDGRRWRIRRKDLEAL